MIESDFKYLNALVPIVLIFLGGIVFFFLSILEAFHGHSFNPIEFGTGLGLLLTGSTGALALKQKSEPISKNKDEEK